MSNLLRPQAVDLLARLSTDGTDAGVWTDLWDELYHRHNGEDACAALPELAELASSGTPADRFQAVELAGALIASAEPHTAEIRDRYAGGISALRISNHDTSAVSVTSTPNVESMVDCITASGVVA
ncbi:hypothetical protein [Nocardia thraciensis]